MRFITRHALSMCMILAITSVLAAATVHIDFDRPASFDNWIADRDSWRVEGGVLIQPQTGHRGTRAFYPRAFSDVSIQAQFFINHEGSGVRAPGLIYRAVDENSYYYIHYDSRNSQVVWVRREPGETWTWTPDNTHRHRPIRISAGHWHTMRVDVIGDTHTIYFDGEKLFSVVDDTYESGIVGLRCGQGHIVFDDVVIEGKPSSLEGEFKLTMPAWLEVCTDAGAGGYEAFPDICRTDDGTLLCVFYAGYAHVSVRSEKWPRGGRVCLVRSEDEGKTWSDPEIVIDTPLDDRDPSISQLSNGDLLVTYFDRDPDRKPGARVFITRSTDGGETWQEPQHVPLPIDAEVASTAVSEPVTELDDGTLLLPVYYVPREPDSPHYKSAVLRSRDMGETWPEAAVIEDAGGARVCEPSIEPLPDGRIYMLLRPSMHWSVSHDDGVTWSEPQELGIEGDAPNLLLTDNEILLAGFRHPPTHSTSVAWSSDYGKTWNGPKIIDRVGGAYPSFVQLPDGRVFMVYYTEGGGSNIRGIYLDVTRHDVSIVPPKEEN